ncbi:hypothetical protein C8F01DRAFT_497381 [Mycena amicta]|nr:hypothetical protein C8F01DRAFT_497381 [Mycena amicta]
MTPFLDAISSHLPPELSQSLTRLQVATPDAPAILDTLIRFVADGTAPNPDTQTSWSEHQAAASRAISAVNGQAVTGKRQREEEDGSGSKRQKTSSESDDDRGAPLFTLHGISANSPVRRKVDITIYSSTVAFINATTGAVETSIPLAVLKRAFLLPTRGKMKPHWTVVVLSVDVIDPSTKKDKDKDAPPQIIFGLDALAPSTVKYTTYTSSDGSPELTTLKSGTATRDLLVDFIRRLQLPVLQPTPAVFKSACPGIAVSASEGGVPGVEAYRAAKAGSLWFMRAGILWGESKPCEFWAVSDLLGRDDGLKMISATGRTCTVVLTRKSSAEERASLEEDEQDAGVETALTMIDGREQEGINKWVREHRDLFGKEPAATAGGSLLQGALLVQDDSDEEDVDFVQDEESDGGSASDESESDDDSDDAQTLSDEGEAGENEDADGESEEEEELRAENHPLMRPGAMPRMSRAAIDMVAAMVTDDMVGADEDEGEDELDD